VTKRPFHDILEFPNVARPGIAHEQIRRRGIDDRNRDRNCLNPLHKTRTNSLANSKISPSLDGEEEAPPE
jgi:hypothetical protein